MHAGIPAAIDEYFLLKNDTLNFIVPDEDYLIHAGLLVAERGDFDNAILIFQAVVSEFPKCWKAYDALGETYIMKGDTISAIQNFKKSIELNSQNTNAKERLKKLEKK
jgi:tetratricopeptide (TPR) repeat protein